jgi:hypothetical protein
VAETSCRVAQRPQSEEKRVSLPTWRHHRATVGRWSMTVSEKEPRMIRVIIDTVLFSCMAAMVTGVVIVAASFLI